MTKRNTLLEVGDKLTLKVAINSLIKELEVIKGKCEELLEDEHVDEKDKQGCRVILREYDDHLENLKSQHEQVYLLSGDDKFKLAVKHFSETSQDISDLITDNLGDDHEETSESH